MKAAYYEAYGNEQTLSLKNVSSPVPNRAELLIDVHATSINASDWEFLTGTPAYARINGLRKPRKRVLGSDISGVVAQVGEGVTQFSVGDPVFCDNLDRVGGFAEQVVVPASKVLKKPTYLSHIVASAIPQSAVIALQALRKYGDVQPEQRIIINGAGGGAGSFAIQLAKLQGAHVTAVDHANKLKFVKQLGADTAWDYQHADITQSGQTFDKIIDFIGHHSVFEFRRLIAPNGSYVIVGGLLRDILGTLIIGGGISLFSTRKMSVLMHQQNAADIMHMAKLIERKQITCCVDRVFHLDDIQQAFRYFREQKALGKIVIQVKQGT